MLFEIGQPKSKKQVGDFKKKIPNLRDILARRLGRFKQMLKDKSTTS